MLTLRNVTKVYDTGVMRVEALRGIDLAFRPNEFVAVLGPSGCGKTTSGRTFARPIVTGNIGLPGEGKYCNLDDVP